MPLDQPATYCSSRAVSSSHPISFTRCLSFDWIFRG